MHEYSETPADKNSNGMTTILADDPSEVMERFLSYYCSMNPEFQSLLEAEIEAWKKS